MTLETLRAVEPTALGPARAVAHHAVQWVTKAARANLAARDDDSHSNLGWDAGVFWSHELGDGASASRVGLRLRDLHLIVESAGDRSDELNLIARSPEQADKWLDDVLVSRGLAPASGVALLYGDLPDLPAPDDADKVQSGLPVLAAWYTLAVGAIGKAASAMRDARPGPSPIRCWPHHFDIATLVVFDEGDAEGARSIGIGLSPGDGSYGEPYVYVTPWPYPDAPPEAALPLGHWHREGFTAAIATGSEILAADGDAAVDGFVEAAVTACRSLLKA